MTASPHPFVTQQLRSYYRRKTICIVMTGPARREDCGMLTRCAFTEYGVVIRPQLNNGIYQQQVIMRTP